MWQTGSIDVLSHPDIFFAILGISAGCYYQLHLWFTLLVVWRCSGISLRDYTSLHHGKCIVSSVTPLVVLRIVNHLPWLDRSYFEKVHHIVVEETSLGHIECWTLWSMNDKFINILTVVGHYMVFLHQYKWQNVGYPLWVIPDRVEVSREVTNLVAVSYYWIAVDTYIW